MEKKMVLDEYFIEARSKLLDVAAFIDRLERSEGPADYRWENLAACLPLLSDHQPEKTRRILELLSDPGRALLDAAPGKGASGAWPGFRTRGI